MIQKCKSEKLEKLPRRFSVELSIYIYICNGVYIYIYIYIYIYMKWCVYIYIYIFIYIAKKHKDVDSIVSIDSIDSDVEAGCVSPSCAARCPLVDQ